MPHRLIPTVNDKRGSYLLEGSAAFLAIGFAYVTVKNRVRSAAFGWLPFDIGADELGWIWVLVGAFGAVAALLSRDHPTLEKIGYQALFVPPMLWALVYLISVIVVGNFPGLLSAVMFGLVAKWIMTVSDWPNPYPPRPRRHWRRPRDGIGEAHE